MVSSGFEDIIEQCKKTYLAEVTKKSLMSLKRNQWVESHLLNKTQQRVTDVGD